MLRDKIEKHLLEVQKPSRYIGGEVGSVIKDKSKIDVRFAFCFPDTYDIGMSHLGMKILYSLTNERENYWCERCFAPSEDFEAVMRENDIPLYALESLDPIKDFDFIGFTMQYELSYANVLNMLDLAGIPIFSKDRTQELTQIVIAGGPCVCNPEPLADFFDICVLGEGEEAPNDTRPDIYCAGLVTVGEGTVIPAGVHIGKNVMISGHTTEADYPGGRLASGKTLQVTAQEP